jgi:hypothetical protein
VAERLCYRAGYMQFVDWQKDSPFYKVRWGGNGYISGFRYRQGATIAWHITTEQSGSVRQYFVTGGQLRSIRKTTVTPTLVMAFETDDVDAAISSEERTEILAAINGWEDARLTAEADSTPEA